MKVKNPVEVLDKLEILEFSQHRIVNNKMIVVKFNWVFVGNFEIMGSVPACTI